jgi:hypothetical protein
MSAEFLSAPPNPEDSVPPDAQSDTTTQAVYGVISTLNSGPSLPEQEAEAHALRTMSVKRNLDIPIRLLELPAAERQRILARNAEHRRLAAEIFPPQPDDLGLDDVDAYFAESGLSTAPASIMTPDEFLVCAKEMIRHGYRHHSLSEIIAALECGLPLDEVDTTAHYLDDLGRVIVLRSPGEITEPKRIILLTKVAHEKAHSTGADEEDTMVCLEENLDMHNGFRQSRGGFAVYDEILGQAGYFLEEGFSELKAIDYVRDRLGLPTGLWTDGSQYQTIAGVTLPSAYVMHDPDTGASETGLGAIPAYGLELIRNVRPELQTALDDSRTSVQGLRRVVRIINSVDPRLYGALLRAPISPEGFTRALETIRQKLAV